MPSYRPRPMWVPAGRASDPQRASAEAARRARGKVRRYCAANGLSRLGTLTYAGEGVFDPVEVRRHVAVFFRDLRSALGGRRLPYLWVPEWHKTHGLHLHFGLGQYVDYRLIRATWGRGIIHIKRLSNLPVGSGELAASRAAAGYLSKYVTKSFDDTEHPRILGRHRYDVAQGFQPQATRFRGVSSGQVLGQAVEVMGGRQPAISWSSDGVEGWRAPPAVWFAWATAH